MENNNLLMIILAFIVGYCVQGMIKNMCGGHLIEGMVNPHYCPKGRREIVGPINNASLNDETGTVLLGTDQDGDFYCEICPEGTYNNSVGGTCTPCKAGTFSSAGATTCTPCEAGTYSSSTGAVNCTDCSAGTYSSAGAVNCINCSDIDLTTYSPANASKCTRCPDGFQPIKGHGGCEACLGSDSQNVYAEVQSDGTKLWRTPDKKRNVKGWGYAGTGGTCSPCGQKFASINKDASSKCMCNFGIGVDNDRPIDPTDKNEIPCPTPSPEQAPWVGSGTMWDPPEMPHRDRNKEQYNKGSSGKTVEAINSFFIS